MSEVKKPDFVFVGASKSGSSSIRRHLYNHPDVYMVEKEIHYFSREELFALGEDWYLDKFKDAPDNHLVGEVSNTYSMEMVFPLAAQRLKKFLPDIKLLYCVRDPIKRIESQWLEKRAHGGEDVHYDFNKAVKENYGWLIDSTNYWKQYQHLLKYYKDEDIQIIFFDEFVKNQLEVMNKCFEFLNVAPLNSLENPSLKAGQTEGRYATTNTLSKMREFKLYQALVKYVPDDFRQDLKRKYFEKKITKKPDWSKESKFWVQSQIEEDNKKLLSKFGMPNDYWSYE